MKHQILHGLFISLLMLVPCTSNAQKVQNYSGSKSYTTKVGYIPGTEKYSYYVDERGNKVYQGTYSFIGKDQHKDDRTVMTATYNLTANYKNGKLNGSYSVNAVYEGKVWKYIKGWIPYSSSAKLSATFADGKPAGTFTAVYKDAMNYNGTVTMKNGKYVGSYDYYGEGNESLWKIKGQLTDKGKLTGSWKVYNITARQEWDMVFENDVLIRKDDKKIVTPPAVQNIAKQFAAGKLTEEQVNDQGYIIKKQTLPLDNFISYLLLLNDDDFAFEQIKGWDFSDYGAKEYQEIEKPDVLSKEGLNKIMKSIKAGGSRIKYREPIDDYYNYECWLNPHYNSQDGYFYLNCNIDFHKKYGYYNQLDKGIVVLTPAQYRQLTAVQDSVAALSPLHYNCTMFELFCDNPDNAEHILLNSKEQCETEKKDLKSSIAVVADKLSDEYVIAYFGSLKDFGWRTTRSIEFGDSCYYISDSSIIICRRGDEITAVPVSFINQLKAYQNFIQNCENKRNNILAEGKKLNSELDQQLSNKANAKSKKFLVKLKESFVATYNSCELTDKEICVQEVKAIRGQYFQNAERNTELESSLSKNFLNNYKNMYKSQQVLPTFNTIDGAKQYKNELMQTNEMQKLFVSTGELYSETEKKHEELENLCGKPYADVFKPYAPKYKAVMAVPKFASISDISTYISQLESINADQQLRTNYIYSRKEAERLNNEINDICVSAKNCKRLYSALYKELPMLWDESADNLSVIQSNIQLLTSIKEQFGKLDLAELDKQLKKVKKVEDFKKALGF